MRIFNEDEILDEAYRRRLITEIEDQENTSRKKESYKRYEILKDRIKKYILEQLLKEVDGQTVLEMQSRIAPVNIFKRVISKKSRVYKTKPKRKAVEGTDQNELDALAEVLNIDTTMKKANKYMEAFYNCDVFVLPFRENGEEKYYYQIKPMPPHMYDVIEDCDNPTLARGYVLSHFDDNTMVYDEDPGQRGAVRAVNSFRDGDGKNQSIADSPADNDEPEKHYIWWGKKYHFTFNSKGVIIPEKSPDDLLNPIGELPAVSFAKDRDDSFWSMGGDDLVDGSVLINTLLTDLYFNAKMQGSGLFYYFGKGVPKTLKVGPNQAITHDIEDGEPTPVVGFASPSPMLAEQMSSIEQCVALLLTTNDLGVNSVQAKLDGSQASSGIQELIQNAEPMNSVEDDQQQFRDKEFRIMNLAVKWHNLYHSKRALVDDLQKIGEIKEVDYSIKFGHVQPFMGEKEKLEIIKGRMDAGLIDKLGAVMEDNPDMDEDEAIQYLKDMEMRAAQKRAEMIREMDANNEEQNQLQPGSDERPEEDEQDSEDQDEEGDS